MQIDSPTKETIRAILSQKRKTYEKTKIIQDSRLIVEKIENSLWFKLAQTVALYFPIQNEVDVTNLLDRHADKNFLFPVCNADTMTFCRFEGRQHMKKGKFGIPEPNTPNWNNSIDAIIVPGVGFDIYMNRLGRGGGYYDKWLSRNPNIYKIGVCYDFQLLNNRLPCENNDIPMDIIIHPYGIIDKKI